MVKCSKCGTNNTDEDVFCSQCGKPLKQEKTINNSSKLNLKICNKCGAKNIDEDMFCNQCGEPLNKEDETTNNETSDRKINLKVILPVFAIVLIAIVGFTMLNGGGMGIFGGNDVTVKEVKLDKYWSKNLKSDMKYYMNFDMDFVPKKTIDHIRSFELLNIEITYGDEVVKFRPAKLKYYENNDNNRDIQYGDIIFEDNYYSFTFELKEENITKRTEINHIKGDIVINTTTQNNLVIGHLDNDVSLSTTKKSTGNRANYSYLGGPPIYL